jgi:hypothetical protein
MAQSRLMVGLRDGVESVGSMGPGATAGRCVVRLKACSQRVGVDGWLWGGCCVAVLSGRHCGCRKDSRRLF